MQYPLSLAPLLPAAGCLAAGILFSMALPAEYQLAATVICVVVAILSALINRRVIAVMIGALCVGMVTFIVHNRSEDAAMIADKEVTAKGYIESVGESNTAQILTVVLNSCITSESNQRLSAKGLKVSLAYPSFTPEMLAGETVRFTATLHTVNSIPVVPDEIDIPASMRNRGIMLQALVKPDSIQYLPDEPTFHAYIARTARKITDIIYRSPLSAPSKEFLATAIMGDSKTLTAYAREEFTRAGIAHVLALSGLHAGIIATLALIILWPLKLTRAAHFIPLIIIIILWGFAILTGLSPSVTRAVIMATSLLGARMLQRRHSSINSLALAAIIILVFDPLAILSASFILSFSAVMGIIVFAEKLNPISRRHRFAYTFASIITVTIAAMLATSLISSWIFHTFPIYFILANLLTSPLLPLIIGGGVTMIVFGAFGWYPEALCYTVDLLYFILSQITHLIASLPGAIIDNIYLSEAENLAIAITIISLALLLHLHRKAYGVAAVLSGMFAIILFIIPKPVINDFGVRIVPQPYHTNIVVSSPEVLDIITTADRHDHSAVEADAKKLYRNHIGKRGITDLRVSSESSQSSLHTFNYPILSTRQNTIFIANNDDALSDAFSTDGQIDILLVCRGFRGNIVNLVEKLHPESIILSSDIDKRRSRKYQEQLLTSKFTNIRDLATKPFTAGEPPL